MGRLQELVPVRLVDNQRTNVSRSRFLNETGQDMGADINDDASNGTALTAHSTRHDGLVLAPTFALGAVPIVVLILPMLVVEFAAHIGFIDLDKAHELLKGLFGQGAAYPMAHMLTGFAGSEPHPREDLQSAKALPAGQHQVDQAKYGTVTLFHVKHFLR